MPLPTFQREGTVLAASFSGPTFYSESSLQPPDGWETAYSKRVRYPPQTLPVAATGQGGMNNGGGSLTLRPGTAVQLKSIYETTTRDSKEGADMPDRLVPGLSYRLEPLHPSSRDFQPSNETSHTSVASGNDHSSMSVITPLHFPLLRTVMPPESYRAKADGGPTSSAARLQCPGGEGSLALGTLDRTCHLEPIAFPSENSPEAMSHPSMPSSLPSDLMSDHIARFRRRNAVESQQGYTQQAVTMRARAYHFVIEPDGSSVTTEDHDSDSPEAKIQSRPVESVSQSATRRDDFGSPPRTETRSTSPLTELSYSTSMDGVPEAGPASLGDTHTLVPSESINAKTSFVASEALDLVDWINHRKVRGYRKGAGETVWYSSSGCVPLQTPPASLCAIADPTNLFLYHDLRSIKLQIWILGDDRLWHAVEDGHVHPFDHSRRLHVQPCGDPSWVTRATYNGYTYHRRKAAGNGQK